MSNVVRLNRKAVVPATSPAFDEAWLSLPDSARTRSSRKMACPEWQKVAAEIGEDELLARVKRYVAEDKDCRKECGAPGFHRWLAWGRWEHWGGPVERPVVALRIFPNPGLRASFSTTFADPKARRWFDLCGWDETTRTILKAPTVRAEWMNGPLKAWALANDVRGITFL